MAVHVDTERIDGILEQVSLALISLILIYSPLAFGAVRATEFIGVIGLTLLALAVWLVRLWIHPRPQLLWPPVCWLILAFTGYALVRAQSATVQFEARAETLRIVVYAALFFFVLNNLYRQDATKFLTTLLSLVALSISIYAATQFFTRDPMVWHLFKPAHYIGRATGTFIYPNHLAGYLTMLLPLAIAFSLAPRLSHPIRIITGYAAIFMLAGIAVTISRGGWLAAFATLVILTMVLFSMRQYRIPAVVVLSVVLVGGAVFYGKAKKDIDARVAAALITGNDADPRWRLWESGFQLWQDRPWAGHGPAHFDLVYPKYRQPANHTQIRPNYALNEYVNTLVDYGAIGVMLITLIFAVVLGGGIRAWKMLSRSGKGDELRGGKRAFLLGGSIGLAGILLASITDFQFHLPANAILAVILMALITGYLRFTTDRHWVPIGKPTLIVLSLAVILTGGFMGARGWRLAQHEYWLRQAAAAETGTEQLVALQRAFDSEPMSHRAAYLTGEYLRAKSWRAEPGYEAKAREAIVWFQRAIDLNPCDSYALVHLGMCHDWLGDHDRAEPYFLRALDIDPNNYFTVAYVGWHYFMCQEYPRSAKWFVASTRLNWWSNYTANTYWRVALTRMRELPKKKRPGGE